MAFGASTVVKVNSLRALSVEEGLVGTCNLRVHVDARAWIKFLRKEWGLARILITGKLRLKGNPRWLSAFGRCFA